MKPETRVAHPPRVEIRPENRPLVDPIYHSVKFTASLEDFNRIRDGKDEGYVYSRIGNPTVRQLERLLAELQGREDALTFTSGIAAVTIPLLALLRSGDHLVHFVESYKASRSMIREFLTRFGIRETLLSIDDTSGLEATLKREKSKLVLFESPTNPVLRIADLERLTVTAKKYGALSMMDNTFAGFHQHGEFPVDLYIHSLTKFAGGHGDTTGGVVIGDRALVQKIRLESWHVGAALDPETADRITRGMKTYFLRYRRQCESAQQIALALEAHPRVSNLRYPGLPSHPEHARAKKQMRDFGTVISFDLEGGEAALSPFIEKLRLFTLASSLGSTDSLVAPSLYFYAADLTAEQRAQAGISDGTVRLSIGVEDADDLIADLKNALST